MRLIVSKRNLLYCIAFLAALGLSYPIFHALLSGSIISQSTALSDAALDELTAERQRNAERSLRLESWGECFQAAPKLLVAVASRQADQLGRRRLRRLWRKKWRLSGGAAQLVFFVRYSDRARRDQVIEEFHREQDLMLNAGLNWQTDANMLRLAAQWYLERCPRTPYLLFVGADGGPHGPGLPLNARLVALHTAGDGVRDALASARENRSSEDGGLLKPGVGATQNPAGQNGTASTISHSSYQPPCLLLPRSMTDQLVRRVVGAEASWRELRDILMPEFPGWAGDAAALFCHSD